MPNTVQFEDEVAGALQRVRSGLAEIIAALPGQVTTGADLHRILGIERKLSWKIFKVVNARDPLAAGPHVPSPGAAKGFFAAASKKGVPDTVVRAAVHAMRGFEDLVVLHAGDRSTFDSMISSLARDEDAGQITLQHRRAAFRANRHIWGVQAKTLLKTMVLRPAEDSSKMDLVRVEGFLSLRKLRPSAPLVVSWVALVDDKGSSLGGTREPLDPSSEPTHGLALLQDFCSKPLPELQAVEAAANFMYGELVSNGVGNKAAITCIEGHIVRSLVPRYRDEHNAFCQNGATVRVSAEALVLDLLVHEDAYGPLAPEAMVLGEHLSELPWAVRGAGRTDLALRESVNHLGKGPSVLHSTDVPRYAELGRYIFDRLGWDGERFDVYRCRIEYPVMPSTVVMRFELPEAPPA
jgi:hypothetical protein